MGMLCPISSLTSCIFLAHMIIIYTTILYMVCRCISQCTSSCLKEDFRLYYGYAEWIKPRRPDFYFHFQRKPDHIPSSLVRMVAGYLFSFLDMFAIHTHMLHEWAWSSTHAINYDYSLETLLFCVVISKKDNHIRNLTSQVVTTTKLDCPS